ncbi:MAG: hypothetical protein A3I39_02180 [Candidatus Yanofskybacteria bacterium RIFCSPLOWO2_02_FULL_47_9b]|uniref:Reverse transcriptase domain-containing protein n=1 Tax=Candidatus Yanofskybacteria bacterium RIFCSPLOWO2_02_FULL_47_9b TaxID=1802708 RepID=A0A1F8H7B2_9BACT|nr:MAG: hypothetical protein A3I39_02180 [Candidatus Yanofskybacteria bacterium RIFCSPLOWO2_02_FULL_47_9b]
MGNIFTLHCDLINHTYRHGPYQAFRINDPKPRQIHKSSVRDRLLHHAVYRVLYLFFDKTFIADSFSCRLGKGTHKAMARFRAMAYQASRNHARTCWVLKCDIRKFFENIHHTILLGILERYIPGQDIMALLKNIIESFSAKPGRGLPLGNLTSQLFVNIYMNEFDQWIKHHMKEKYYIRYADDFAIFSRDKSYLEELLPKLASFLEEKLKLQIHPDKVFIKTLASGIDFLGWVHFPDHRVLRTVTKRRMLKKIRLDNRPEVLASYRGLLSHGNAKKLAKKL